MLASESDWNVGEAFGGMLGKAMTEGVNIFAEAPLEPMTPKRATEEQKQALVPSNPSVASTLQHGCDKAVDSSLTRDYFDRPSWNNSVVPKKQKEDLSLEAIARERRVMKLNGAIKAEGFDLHLTDIGFVDPEPQQLLDDHMQKMQPEEIDRRNSIARRSILTREGTGALHRDPTGDLGRRDSSDLTRRMSGGLHGGDSKRQSVNKRQSISDYR
jgi:hypothetical protein